MLCVPVGLVSSMGLVRPPRGLCEGSYYKTTSAKTRTRRGRETYSAWTRDATDRGLHHGDRSAMTPGLDWIDPRPARPAARLAARAGGTGRRLVFFDNSKLSPPYDRWVPLAPPILAAMAAMGSVQREYCDLLMEPVARHAQRVAGWKAQRIDGIFFGLCDAGVVQPTLLLATAAEAAGIPTAVLCTSQVIDLAAVSASFLMPGIPLLLIEADRLAGPEGLGAAGSAIAPEVVRALTAPPADLVAAAQSRFPFIEGLARGDGASVSPDAFSAFAEQVRISDGLPVIQPTRARVDAMLAAAGRDGAEILAPSVAPSGAPLCVEQAAACAVMAGCSPRRFPLVLAALEAMADPAYELHLATITTHPGGHLLLFSGPAAHAAGIASGRGCMGPAQVANMQIGRSVALVLQNVARAISGLSMLSTFGSPAQFACCFADAENGSIAPLHTRVVGEDETICWVFKCESPHNVLDHLSETPQSLLGTIADSATTLGCNNAYMPSDLLVIMNPEHARLCRRAGWDRTEIATFLWEHARNPRAALAGRGAKNGWPAGWKDWPSLPIVESPERIVIVEAGGPGPQSMVAVPWGYNRPTWTRVRQTGTPPRIARQ
ncbi:MAG: hypothetical protein AB7G13_23075 [Lautropia sp.]